MSFVFGERGEDTENIEQKATKGTKNSSSICGMAALLDRRETIFVTEDTEVTESELRVLGLGSRCALCLKNIVPLTFETSE